MGRKTGKLYPCVVCGNLRWRTPSDVRRNIRQTCSKACNSKMMSGPGNPFWGKTHSPEMVEKIRAIRRSRPNKTKSGPPKGYKHTAEARAKISEGHRRSWIINRDKRLAAVQAGGAKQRLNRSEEPRYRSNFTPYQRKEWKAGKCAYCDTTDGLVLDHIIPVMAGGTNDRTNAQTLCQPCNLWKMAHVDRALTIALLGSKSGQDGQTAVASVGTVLSVGHTLDDCASTAERLDVAPLLEPTP